MFNTLRLKQNGHRFADSIFKGIFLNENVGILIQISLNIVSEGPIDSKLALVQVMAWHWTGDQAITWTNADPVHRGICEAVGGDEVIASEGIW